MKPHPRTRRVVKWGASAIAVLLLLVLLLSGKWTLSLRQPGRFHINFAAGTVLIAYWPPTSLAPGPIELKALGPGFGGRDHPYVLEFRGSWMHRSGDWIIVVPLWLPAVMAIAAAVGAWRFGSIAGHKIHAGLCPHCHYNRTGLTATSLCPECGHAPTA